MTIIFDRLFRKKKVDKEKEDKKIKILYTEEEYKKALSEALDSAKEEVIIITDDFSEFK